MAASCRVRQSADPRARSLVRAVRSLRAGPARLHAVHRGDGSRLCGAARGPPPHRVPAADGRGRPLVHANDPAGRPPRGRGTRVGSADRAIVQFDEVASVFGKVGRAETATNPAPMSMAETIIHLRPRAEWPEWPRQRWYSGWAPAPLRGLLGLVWPERAPRTSAELVEALNRATRLPGWSQAWTAPARARLDMMTTGVRTPAGVRVITEQSRATRPSG